VRAENETSYSALKTLRTFPSARTEVRELHIIREAFMSKYGRDWAIKVSSNEGGDTISQRVLSKINTATPSKDLVDLYLFEIAKAYGLHWRPEGMLDDLGDDNDSDGNVAEPDTAAQEQRLMEADLAGPSSSEAGGSGTNNGNGGGLNLPSAPSDAPRLSNVKNSTTSVPILPPGSSQPKGNDTLPTPPPIDPVTAAKTVIIRSNLGASPDKDAAATPTVSQQGPPAKGSSFDDLAKRFEALKRK